MTRTKRIVSIALTALFILGALSFAVGAYGADDQRLTITHINVANTYEGAAIVISGVNYNRIGKLGNFAWWKVVVFDWDSTEKVYKISAMNLNANNVDKSDMNIPEKGFAYGVCIGNDYSASGGINYINDPTKNSYMYLTASNVHVGDKAYLYNTDLVNGFIKTNGETWYESSFNSDSYVKLFTPDAGMTAYDPDNATLINYYIRPNTIDRIDYATGKSIILTSSFGEYAHNGGSASFQWWKSVVFDYDLEEGCYVVKSLDLMAGNEYPKQPVIPNNGFVLVDCYLNSANIDLLNVGDKCYLHDIDLAAGTLGADPRISVNCPDSGVAYYTPAIDNRLGTPVVNEAVNGYINTLEGGKTITWNAVPGATSYIVSINNAGAVPDGPLVVAPTNVNGTSYTISSSILSIGSNYTIRVIARGNKPDSSFNNYKVKCISETAANSSLVNKRVLAFGDSLTARPGYVAMLYNYIGTEVINAAISGNTTAHGRARFEDDVLAEDPDIAIICFGMNDQACIMDTGKPIIDLDTYRANLEYFAATLIENGCDVVFFTPNPPCTEPGYYSAGSYGLDYAYGFMPDFVNAIRETAAKYECGLVDINYECEFEDLTQFLAYGDGIHQSTYGHTRYAELISDYLLAKYDGLNKATITVNCIADGQVVKSYEMVGKQGAHVTVATPEIDGYSTADDDVKTTFSDKTVTFNYTNDNPSPTSFNVIYNANGGSGAPASQVKGAGIDLVLSEDEPSRNYYDFLGWADSASATEPQYQPGDTYTSDANITLFAVWKLRIGDVNNNGGIDATDYLMAKRTVLETYNASEIERSVADVNKSGGVDATDYLMIKRHVLGTYSIAG